MSNRTLFIATLFLLLSPWWLLGLGNAPEKPEKNIHVSEEVKISSPEKQVQKQPDKAASSEAEKREKPRKERSGLQAAKETGRAGQKSSAKQEQAAAQSSGAEDELGEMMLNDQESMLADQQRLYTRKGRVDPFEPFVNREETKNEENESEEELKRRKPQTPLERIALSQLKLTAVLRLADENKAIAMVEDQTGKGYVVNEGTYIGENGGRVAAILSDRIVIEEKYKDLFGKIAVREIEKKLQK